MIDKHFGDYILVCDICAEEAEECFDTFDEAVEGKKKLNWVSEKTSKGWHDVCVDCQV